MPDTTKDHTPDTLLTQEQEYILEHYLLTLDNYYEGLQAAEKLQVEIETQHLKRILDI
ncbi:hypothetical protein MKJ04_15150 [Pontibacter sp. E15-1]|uniref:hypothetical protein n=1 Tax=Pontibacter sp. E15-1 TaxID=2919918 RepID=UPI001F4FD8E3|nr:hypothetical protein [Pontibacter sp. E15-1]MCJ8166183.1 hypothetical protein [Pontibacter sp. E15-1]